MEPFTNHEGIAVLIDQVNIDTDQIIPKQFLKRTSRTGYGKYLFHSWRYLDDGSENPEFELNHPLSKQASILVAGDNFGCGSSREHAPWAIGGYGFRVIISSSFADIFYSNCFKNGLLPAVLTPEDHIALTLELKKGEGTELRIDLEQQTVKIPENQCFGFSISPFHKTQLLNGLDDIAWTLRLDDRIRKFEERQKKDQPWFWRESN